MNFITNLRLFVLILFLAFFTSSTASAEFQFKSKKDTPKAATKPAPVIKKAPPIRTIKPVSTKPVLNNQQQNQQLNQLETRVAKLEKTLRNMSAN